jgi:hypothetical protein
VTATASPAWILHQDALRMLRLPNDTQREAGMDKIISIPPSDPPTRGGTWPAHPATYDRGKDQAAFERAVARLWERDSWINPVTKQRELNADLVLEGGGVKGPAPGRSQPAWAGRRRRETRGTSERHPQDTGSGRGRRRLHTFIPGPYAILQTARSFPVVTSTLLGETLPGIWNTTHPVMDWPETI